MDATRNNVSRTNLQSNRNGTALVSHPSQDVPPFLYDSLPSSLWVQCAIPANVKGPKGEGFVVVVVVVVLVVGNSNGKYHNEHKQEGKPDYANSSVVM